MHHGQTSRQGYSPLSLQPPVHVCIRKQKKKKKKKKKKGCEQNIACKGEEDAT